MHIVDYTGHPQAERVLILMGSGAQTAAQTVVALHARGERVGVIQVRLYRPFPAEALLAALPETVRTIGVLDRTPNPSRVVVRIVTAADCARTASMRSPAASRTCSQLSNTNNRTLPSNAAATLLPGC